MKNTRALKHAAITALACTLTASAFAQQQTPTTATTDLERQQKFQVTLFELTLSRAVLQGGQTLSIKTKEIAPTISIFPTADPVVRGWHDDRIGYQFYVEIPNVGATSIMVLQQYQRMNPANAIAPPQPPSPSPTQVANGNQQIPGTGKVSASAVVTPDPTTPPAPFDPVEFYSNAVRDALYDAILDNSSALRVGDAEILQVVAGPTPESPNSLQPQSRKLILEIKGSDLSLLRQGQLTREQAKQRIIEQRF